MPTNFPQALDNLTNPLPGDSQSTIDHAGQHANINDAMEAVQTFLGTTTTPGPGLFGLSRNSITFPTLAAAKAATVPATFGMIVTTSWAKPGDGGGARYQRVSADPAVGAGGFRTLDRFLPTQATDLLNGGFWRYVLQGPALIEQFGGACDCPNPGFDYAGGAFVSSYTMPTAGTWTDNLQPFYDAIATVNATLNPPDSGTGYGSLYPIDFLRSQDLTMAYGFSGVPIPQYTCRARGNHPGGDAPGVGTTFRFPPNVGGLVINHRKTQPAGYRSIGAGFSSFEGIWFQGGGGTNRKAHGIWHRMPVKLTRCTFDSFAGNGNNNVGSVGYPVTDERFGQTSGSHYIDVTCRNSGNYNTYCTGTDVSASQFDNLQHKGSRIAGLVDTSLFSNTYTNYGNHGHGGANVGACQYNGRAYQLNSLNPGDGSATTPGTSDAIWEDLGPLAAPTTYFPAWSAAKTWECSVPSLVSDATTVNGYVEAYYLRQVGGMATGTPFAGRYCTGAGSDTLNAGMDVLYSRNVGVKRTLRPVDALAGQGVTYVGTRLGGAINAPQAAFGWFNNLDPNGWNFEYSTPSRARFGYAMEAQGAPPTGHFLGQYTTESCGRANPTPGAMAVYQFALGDATGSAANARFHYTFAGAAAASGRAQGEIGYRRDAILGGTAMVYHLPDGTPAPLGIIGATQATGLSSSSTAAQIYAALKAAGLAA